MLVISTRGKSTRDDMTIHLYFVSNSEPLICKDRIIMAVVAESMSEVISHGRHKYAPANVNKEPSQEMMVIDHLFDRMRIRCAKKPWLLMSKCSADSCNETIPGPTRQQVHRKRRKYQLSNGLLI